MFGFFEAVPLEAICPYRLPSILWLQIPGLPLFSCVVKPCLPDAHRTAGFPLCPPPSDTTRLHTACSLSQFSPVWDAAACSQPQGWQALKLVTSTSFISSPIQEFTHPQLYGEIMQHIHWHSVSTGNNLKIHALFPHKEKGKASEKYTIIILKELVQ